MWSFLANLGSGLGRLGSSFARGAVSAGKGIGRGLGRLGSLAGGEDLEAPGPFGTPGINPNAGYPVLTPPFNPNAGYPGQRGVRLVEDAVAGAENDARSVSAPIRLPGGHDLPDLPISRRDLPIPALTPAPPLNELRSALPSLPARRPRMPVAAPALPPAAAGAVEALAPKMDLDRLDVPIPRLPGHAGGPISYNPIDAARYDSVMSHSKRDSEGNLIPKSEGGGFKRDWGTTLRNAFLAASLAARSAGPGEDPLGAALGGALSAGAGSAINPQAGYEFAFDFGERPKLEAGMAREQAAKDRANLEILNQAKLEGIRAETGLKGAQADKARADMEIGIKAEDRARLMDEYQRRHIAAQTLTELMGEPQTEDIFNPVTGQIERVKFYPGGRKEVLGLSGRAETDLRDIKSREKIAREGESGEYGREAMRQSGQDRRQERSHTHERKMAEDSGGGDDKSELKNPSDAQSGQRVTADQLQRYAASRKMTPEKARQALKDMGYSVE